MSRIFDVNFSEISLLNTNPQTILITADGRANSSGWKNPSLAPWFYVVPPDDGIQDMDFMAEEPSGIALTVMTPIATSEVLSVDPSNYWGEGRPLNGVRIHAQNNTIEAFLDRSRVTTNFMSMDGGDTSAFPWLAAFKQMKRSDILKMPVSSLLGHNVRLYTEGDLLTFDNQPARLNIELSRTTGLIQRFWFG